MRRRILFLGLLFTAVLTLSACGQREEAAPASGETKSFTIHASNYEFDVKEIKVKQGDTVKITLENTEGLHSVKFAGYDKEVKSGETITFTADKTGEYDYVCGIFCGEGHAGMRGKLIVE